MCLDHTHTHAHTHIVFLGSQILGHLIVLFWLYKTLLEILICYHLLKVIGKCLIDSKIDTIHTTNVINFLYTVKIKA